MVTTTQQPGAANLEIDVELAEECIYASVSFGTRTKQSATEETTMGKSITLCSRGGRGLTTIEPARGSRMVGVSSIKSRINNICTGRKN